jgi:hypothetical protein
MLFALKIRTQSIAQQAFAKPAWAGKEVGLALIYKIIDVICLINIETLLVPQIFKTLYAQRIVYHNALIFSGLSMRKDNVFCGKSKKRFAHRVNLGYILYF